MECSPNIMRLIVRDEHRLRRLTVIYRDFYCIESSIATLIAPGASSSQCSLESIDIYREDDIQQCNYTPLRNRFRLIEMNIWIRVEIREENKIPRALRRRPQL